jgi:hypothetical protein
MSLWIVHSNYVENKPGGIKRPNGCFRPVGRTTVARKPNRYRLIRNCFEQPGTIVKRHDFENFPIGISPRTTAPLDYLIDFCENPSGFERRVGYALALR